MKIHVLKNKSIELTLVPEFGCHWASLKTFHQNQWWDLLYPVPDPVKLPERPYHDGSYVLAPWSNRIQGAALEFEGKKHQLKSNFPDGTAIHGDVWTRPWTVTVRKATRFEAALDSSRFPDFNYPFPLAFRMSLVLEGNSLNVRLTLQNKHAGKAPVGMGFHPFWKRRLTPEGSDVSLTLPADMIYPTKEAIPQGKPERVTGHVDLRRGQDLEGVDLDDCFTGLTSQEILLTYAKPGVRIRYQMDPIFGHVVVYSPLDEKGNPREFVAVEPVSHVTDGFNLLARGWQGTGVKVLESGETWGGTWTLTFEDVL